jgi:dipeptidase E
LPEAATSKIHARWMRFLRGGSKTDECSTCPPRWCIPRTKRPAWGGGSAFDALYIGGGNTFYLLQQIRHHRLDHALDAFIAAGKPVYGGSAGAIILGYDISSCAHIDENIIGLEDFSGFDHALGTTLWCHYWSKDDGRIQKYVKCTGVPSIAISERSGVVREGDQLISAGYEPVVYFTLNGMKTIPVGNTILSTET